jgi:hypothetical protein
MFMIASVRLHAHENGIREIEVKEDKVMMKRQGEWIMPDKRFPRLKGGTASDRLQELIEVVQL